MRLPCMRRRLLPLGRPSLPLCQNPLRPLRLAGSTRTGLKTPVATMGLLVAMRPAMAMAITRNLPLKVRVILKALSLARFPPDQPEQLSLRGRRV